MWVLGVLFLGIMVISAFKDLERAETFWDGVIILIPYGRFMAVVIALTLIIEFGPRLARALLDLLVRGLTLSVTLPAHACVLALRWTIDEAGPRVAAALSLGFTFAVLLAQEWWRGPPPDEAEEDEEEEDRASSVADDYEQALGVLGLAPGFTREALRLAYRRAIRSAHPDAGGSQARAQEINAAHDVLRQAHGWR